MAASVDDDGQLRLEEALGRLEAASDTALKAAAVVAGSLKRVRTSAHNGNLRDLRPALGAAEQAVSGLRQAVANAKGVWDFDEDTYFSNGSFVRELLETAAQLGLRLFEQDDRLYSYPSLIRLLPNERAVLIDKTRERRLRPSVLVAHLRDLQKRPPRFKPEAFLEALFSAYTTVLDVLEAKRGRSIFGRGSAVKLLDVYDLLTLLPGQTKEYSRQEFARDVYLLDQSGVTITRKGHSVSFPASTGTKAPASTIRVITQNGQEKLYYAIAFQETSA